MRLGVLLVVLAVPFLATACVTRSSEDEPTTPWPGSDSVRVFDGAALEGDNGIKKILVEDYKIADVESITCPEDQEVRQGSTFDCAVEVGGDDPRELTVTITVTDEETGEYQVGLPE